MTQSYLGEFEQLVILAVLRLGDSAYGMTVHREIKDTARRHTSFGAIYTTLERLEEKGLVSSSVGEATSERGGKAKRYFRVNAAGVRALKETLRSTESMKAGLENVLGRVRC